jgi:hypothetical protein
MRFHAKASLRPEERRNLNIPFGESSPFSGGCQDENLSFRRYQYLFMSTIDEISD